MDPTVADVPPSGSLRPWAEAAGTITTEFDAVTVGVRYHEIVWGVSSSNVVSPTRHVTGGMRALGTTVSVPCDWGSTKLYVMLCVAPAGMSTDVPTSRVGPSGPLVTTDRADGDETWRTSPGRLTVAIPTYSP